MCERVRGQFPEGSGGCFAGFAALVLETRGVGAEWAIEPCIEGVGVSVRGSVMRRGYEKEIGVETSRWA